MKSGEMKGRPVGAENENLWLQDIRADQGRKLEAAFSHRALKRKTEIVVAFTAGLLLSLCAQTLTFISVMYSIYALGLVSTVGVVVSLFYIRASVRAFLASTEYQRAASSSIRIVPGPDAPAEINAAAAVAPPPPTASPN